MFFHAIIVKGHNCMEGVEVLSYQVFAFCIAVFLADIDTTSQVNPAERSWLCSTTSSGLGLLKGVSGWFWLPPLVRVGSWVLLVINRRILIPHKQNVHDELFSGITWLVVWNIFYFFHILGIIIPTDELHHFSEELVETTNHLPSGKLT